jgi:hypothetical protein
MDDKRDSPVDFILDSFIAKKSNSFTKFWRDTMTREILTDGEGSVQLTSSLR